MKIAVAIATEDALPDAFVVFRGLAQSMREAAKLGYDGVELALCGREQADSGELKRLLREYGLAVPAISTGQMFAKSRLCFTSKDSDVRQAAVAAFKGLTDMASEFGAMISVGRVRGCAETGETAEEAEKRLAEVMGELAAYAERAGVTVLLEPVNRYEINLINSLDEGEAFIRKCGSDSLKLMPDVFHMNIEDGSIEGSLRKHRRSIRYLHLADSNRLAPGWGHLDFPSIFGCLREIGYDGWATVEILPKPDPVSAAEQAIRYVRRFI